MRANGTGRRITRYHASKEPFYGLEMIEELGRHGYRLSPGTLYPVLHGLEARGQLRSRVVAVRGKRRRIYTITPAGRRALTVAKHKARELFGEIFEKD